MLNKNKTNDSFDISSKVYFKEISKFKSLSIEEEMSLWKKYKYENDIRARDKIITSNLKFVASVAKSYQGRGLSYSDLIAEGNCGLLRALDKFDYKKGYKTISYSVWWIKQTILEALKERNNLNSDELPYDYEKQVSDDDTIDDLDNNDNIIFKEYNESSIEEIKKIVNLLINCLTEREYKIISQYFGLNCDSLTLEEIGEQMNLTKERIRQIKNVALNKLRAEALSKFITSDIYK